MSFRKFFVAIALVCALFAITFPAQAEWKVLGVVKANKGIDRDEIRVGNGRGYRKIKLKANGADVDIQSLHVIYANGEPDKLEVRQLVRQGTTTFPLDLRGDKRVIDKIILWYKTSEGENRKAIVTIYGKN